MKILVPLQGAIFFRNFISSGALSSLAEKHEVVILPGANFLRSYPLPAGLSFGRDLPRNKRREKIRFYVQEFVMCGFRNRSQTFRIKLYRLSWKKKYIYPLIAFPWTARLVQSISERLLGTDPDIDALVKEYSPDWLIIPSSCDDSATADFIKAGRKTGARSMIVVNGWDNLTSKGTIPVMPDRLGVWGPQAERDALEVHRVPKERIGILGTPHFERYFRTETDEAALEEVRRMNGIPEGRQVILFGGCLQPFDEIAVLRVLDSAIERGEIPNAHILFRPHPWRHHRPHEDPFVATEYRHVSLDVQVAEMFLKVKKTGNAGDSHQQYPDLDYYPKIMRLAQFVISPLSTFVLESLLMGKRTIAICYSDGRHYFSADKISQYDHVQYLTNAPGLKFCRQPEDLVRQCRELLEPVDQVALLGQIRDHLRYVVFSDDRSYPERLSQLVEGR